MGQPTRSRPSVGPTDVLLGAAILGLVVDGIASGPRPWPVAVMLALVVLLVTRLELRS